jgi:hypothetical protein
MTWWFSKPFSLAGEDLPDHVRLNIPVGKDV